MRPSILPTIVLALMLVAAGAFGAWFVLSQEEPAPPPIALAPDTLEEPAKADRPADGTIVRPDDPAKPPTPKVEDKPQPVIDKPETPKSVINPKGIDTAKSVDADKATLEDRLKNARSELEKAGVGETVQELADIEKAMQGEKVPFSATISGTVTDNKAAPIAGASVYADLNEMFDVSTGKGATRMSFSMATTESKPKGTPVATTDAAGNFTAQVNRDVREGARVNVSLTAKADGFAISRPQAVTVKNGETKDGVKLSVRGAGSVAGRVVDGTGRGVADVKVSLSGSASPVVHGGDIETVFSGVGGGGGESAVSDAAGNFTITGVAEGRHRPTARANGWRQLSGPNEVTVKAGEEARLPADFVMAAATQLKAKFTTTDGKPVVNYVTVVFKDGTTPVKTMGGMTNATDGTLSLNDAPAGTFTVEVRAFGFKPLTLNGTFIEGQPTDLGAHVLEKAEGKQGITEGIYLPGEGG